MPTTANGSWSALGLRDAEGMLNGDGYQKNV